MPPLRVDRVHLIEQRRKLFGGQPHAGLFQPVERFGKTLADGGVEIFQRRALRDADAQAGKLRRLER